MVDSNRLLGFNVVTGELTWESADGGGIGLPAVAAGVVLFGTSGGAIYAIAESSGSVLWQRDLGSSACARPGAFQDCCCFGTDAGQVVVCETANGEIRWCGAVSARIDLPIAATDGKFLVFDQGHTVSCFSAAEGTLAWRQPASYSSGTACSVDDFSSWPMEFTACSYAGQDARLMGHALVCPARHSFRVHQRAVFSSPQSGPGRPGP